MKKYIIPFVLVLLGMFLPNFGINEYIAYIIKTILGVGAIIYFWKQYDEIKVKFDFMSWIVGLVLIAIWIGLEFLYTGTKTDFNPFTLSSPLSWIVLISKLIGMVVVAAVVEELFIRSFLARLFIDPNKWEKVPIGTFSWMSFIITVIIFGFMHDRWIVGIISGIIFNLWLYYKKDMFACIQCHASANLFLAIYAILTHSWFLW